MNEELVSYIFRHYFGFAKRIEKEALAHFVTYTRAQDRMVDGSIWNAFIRKGHLSDDPDVLGLLANGFDFFRWNVVEEIITLHSELIYINRCPKCGAVARSPFAKQCQICSHDWHKSVVASFRPTRVVEHIGTRFWIVGTSASGEIMEGQILDLVSAGLGRKVRIDAVDRNIFDPGSEVWEDRALGISGLSDREKDVLRRISPSYRPFNIEAN